MSYKLGKKVWILHKKTDGTYNKGKIVGIKSVYPFLGFKSEKDFLSDIQVTEYQVAYVNGFNGKGYIDWYLVKEITDVDPHAK